MGQMLPYPLLRGQPLKCVTFSWSTIVYRESNKNLQYINLTKALHKHVVTPCFGITIIINAYFFLFFLFIHEIQQYTVVYCNSKIN